MGGCRCIFRDCTVSTVRNPQMHFFHFPVKNKLLNMEWIKMAGVEHLLKLPAAQQRNRVICGRHFREECFMNYKKNRLVANNPIPTLMRLNRTVALDYSKCNRDGIPSLIELEKTKMPHLIPPPGYECALELDDDEVFVGDVKVSSLGKEEVETSMPSEVELEDEIKVQNVAEEKEESINLPTTEVNKSVTTIDLENMKKRFSPKNELRLSKKIKIINKEYARAVSLSVMQQKNIKKPEQTQLQGIYIDCDDDSTYDDANFIEIQEYTEDKVENSDEEDFAPYNANQAKENASEKLQLGQQLNKERNDDYATVSNMKKLELSLKNANERFNVKILELEAKNAELTKLAEANEKLTHRNQELQQRNVQLNLERETLMHKCEQWDAKHRKLQETYALLQEKCTKLETEKRQERQQVGATSTSNELLPIAAASSNNFLPSASSTSTPLQTPTKAQLFNGIKKYLSSSMTALVRIEMFGNAEREWKMDERRVAVDLLQLGEKVYTYLTDEWRFRLPALRQVRVWLNETIAEDEEDL